MNDNEIIQRTTVTTESDGTLLATFPAPIGEPITVKAESRESFQKRIIAWCDMVRNEIERREEDRLAEQAAMKARRDVDLDVKHPLGNTNEKVLAAAEASMDSAQASVIKWYHQTQEKIDELGEKIKELTEERNKLRDERDKIEPIVRVWEGDDT